MDFSVFLRKNTADSKSHPLHGTQPKYLSRKGTFSTVKLCPRR